MQTLWQDLRYGMRMLLKKPGFNLIGVLTLALGIGANTAIFSVVNALFLRPLSGVERPDHLVMAGWSEKGKPFTLSSYPNYVDLRDRNTVFSGLAAYSRTEMHLSTWSAAERITGEMVSGTYFTVLGVKPPLGRMLLCVVAALACFIPARRATKVDPMVALRYD